MFATSLISALLIAFCCLRWLSWYIGMGGKAGSSGKQESA
jgi:hypothetical protein